MNIVRTLILSALGVGAFAFATPSQAADVVVRGGTYYSGDRYYRYHHHHRDWEREHRGRVILRNNDAGVSVAFGGHRHHYYHDRDRNYYHRDWDNR